MTRSLVASIRDRQHAGLFPVISEVKSRSPKEGDLLAGRDPVTYARAMASAGVAGISVVTEPEHFGGSMDVLRAVVAAVDLPVLAKDFVTSPDEIDPFVQAGAAALLLIASHLEADTLAALVDHARARGIETLVEAHTVEEARIVGALPGDLLGINNRDITVLEVDDSDVSRTAELAGLYPAGRPVVSESAIAGPADVRRAAAAGADAVLVGTAALRAPDTVAFLRGLAGVGWPV
ncbi:indole-3-glycerol phosphate synthase [Raineyella antarctica]|uniref:indole-3-glycerol-phosphate synthase n=1 Tax=Raineyella antarctica TaxID=1577474 RepID=A0A1G6HHY4_9ACTN|nr:indole-3-glycerol-phosphate synthase [Raineyella antarctica]SDB93555.1 indole-3-glycerol phosphate synthase [Raineyella antarctica]